MQHGVLAHHIYGTLSYPSNTYIGVSSNMMGEAHLVFLKSISLGCMLLTPSYTHCRHTIISHPLYSGIITPIFLVLMQYLLLWTCDAHSSSLINQCSSKHRVRCSSCACCYRSIFNLMRTVHSPLYHVLMKGITNCSTMPIVR